MLVLGEKIGTKPHLKTKQNPRKSKKIFRALHRSLFDLIF